MQRLGLIATSLLLGTLLACGGGSGGGTTPSANNNLPAATKLVYTDPSGGTYKLVRNPSLSKDGHLVLDLVGPASDKGNGVALFLSTEAAKAVWSKVAATDADLVQNGGVFDLGTTTPLILKAKISPSGNELQAALSEKGNATGKSLNGVLARVALDLKSGLTPGTTITLAAASAKCQVLLPAGSTPVTQVIPIATGTLTVQ